ncbi:MAG: MarR family transcriptional regulator [Bacteroidales bacterium]|nr:MarR family transcriptional regulator [Bacteroidales bacterium]
MDGRFNLDNQLCFRLYTASRLITQAYHPLLSEYGLTYPQYLVLLVLWEKDAQPVNDIAKRLLLETNTVTPLLKRMEAEGILTRTQGIKDARQMIVSLTPKGRNLQKKLSAVPETVGSSVLCDSVTPATVPGLFGMLDGIINQLKNNKNEDNQ